MVPVNWSGAIPMEGDKKNVLLGVTGSVAAIKSAELVSCLTQSNFNVQVVATKDACNFFDKSQLGVPVYVDADEYAYWEKRGDPVLHIQIAGGFCDNLLTCIARAWYFTETAPNHLGKVGIFAPAMNTSMWMNPLTSGQVDILCNKLNWTMIDPIHKTLMCGDFGQGAMEEPQRIVRFLQNNLTTM